ncbi:hypothetical protein [Paenibacillus gansuensis]|uniref:Uncharacterized protein n=1 Tax=Paenibacillus gansuensis TaxID=306542 RepID=A0ABW5PJN2_9BACL
MESLGRRKRRFFRVLLLLAISSLICSCEGPELFGLRGTEHEKTASLVESSQIVKLQPINLQESKEGKYFKVFAPHAAVVDVDYNGEKTWINFRIEVWSKGKLLKSTGNFAEGLSFLPAQPEKGRQIFVSPMVNSAETGKSSLDIFYGFISKNGHSSTTFHIPDWEKYKAYDNGITIHETNAADTEQIPIWGMQATTSGMFRTTDLTKEFYQNQEWMAVGILSFSQNAP